MRYDKEAQKNLLLQNWEEKRESEFGYAVCVTVFLATGAFVLVSLAGFVEQIRAL